MKIQVVILTVALTLSTTSGAFQLQANNSDEDVNECLFKPNVCQNGATCINTQGGYQCICVNGWTGRDCNENVDDCSTAACDAGATCIDKVGHFSCQCPPGRIGLLCQLEDGCFKQPCHPNATCDTSPVDGRAICTCPPGFEGADCSVDINECAAGSPCEHGGLCVNTPGSFRCECPQGFSGTRCEININECEINPCMNDGTCLDEKGGYRCICMPGFKGQKCQIEVDECATNPCQNGAICKDYVNSFRCICPTGYWGERCEYSHNKSQKCSPDGFDCVLGTGNPWARCSNPFACWQAFKDGNCDQECNTAECLYDGNDCVPSVQEKQSNSAATSKNCEDNSDSYCLKNYANGVCDQECNSAECGWDGSDCEVTRNDIFPTNTMATGLLVIRVEPAITLNSESRLTSDVELAKLLRKVSVMTKTILKVQSFRDVEEGRGTEIELIADNRKCQASCYNSTELIARFLSAIKTRTPILERPPGERLNLTLISTNPHHEISDPSRTNTAYLMVVFGIAFAFISVLMVVSIGNKQKVKEKATVWFPEGFKPVVSSRSRDPTNRKPGRGVSTLQALGGNFFRGIKRNERKISTDPNYLQSTEIDRCATSTPNGIYHEPYEYGTYIDVDEPMTPTPQSMNPINVAGPHGLTPLMVASMGPPSSKEPLGLVQYGTTGEMNASTDNSVTDLLHRGAQLSVPSKVLKETALHLAARYKRVDAARSLLEQCGTHDVNARDGTGRTPLHAAIAADSLGVFELLMRSRNTDLNAQTFDGTTPLILATRVGVYSMIEDLINNECEVTKSDFNGKTALHWAAATNNKDAIIRLLKVKETNKDAQDLAEETPLFLAAREGAKDAVEILLSHNANKDISDNMDRLPIEVARSRQHLDIVRLLEEYEPPTCGSRTPRTPRSVHSIHHSSSQSSPFFPSPPPDSNSNSSSAAPQPTYQSDSYLFDSYRSSIATVMQTSIRI